MSRRISKRRSRSRARGNEHDTQAHPPIKWLRFPIVVPDGRKLRVLIYARFSTDDQKRSRSIEAQIRFCKTFLQLLEITDVEFTIIEDRALSGEIVSRPGINEVKVGIVARKWDMILVEDSSRPYRHQTACMSLFCNAVDQGIRVIAIEDDVDTADEETWQDRLNEAQAHHTRSNRHTSKRIKRKHTELWEIGAALGPIRSGHVRVATYAATEKEPEEGPFFDELDRKWIPIIYEAFARIANNEPTWSVTQWLTEQGLPKTSNSTTEDWHDFNTISMIRETVHRAHDEYRVTITKKHHGSGRHIPEQNVQEEVLVRDMPHLRIVPDWLWYKANATIDARNNNQNPLRGEDHPLWRIPKNDRGPLSEILVCGCPEEPNGPLHRMNVDGRAAGGYKCSRARKGECWNKASAIQRFVHQQIGRSIIEQINDGRERLHAYIDHLREVLPRIDGVAEELDRFLQQKSELEKTCERLADAIEQQRGPSSRLAQRLDDKENELIQVRAEIERIESEGIDASQIPSKSSLDQIIDGACDQLRTMTRETKALLIQIAPVIRAIPYQQFGCGLVVLRAHCELNLVGLLPAAVQLFLEHAVQKPEVQQLPLVSMRVDLFDMSTGPKYGLKALRLKEEEGLGLTAIGKRLGITKRKANIAVQYGRELRAAGLSDPYIELKKLPSNASRWRELHSRSKTRHESADENGDAIEKQ